MRSPIGGSFEIYRVESENPLQFVSEQVGKYNEPIELDTGSYLVLGDCSHETIVIRPEILSTLVAHEVKFVPPIEPNPRDNFFIQCNRFDKTRSRQNLSQRFSLNILSGKRDLLVGMVPMAIDLVPNDNGPTIQTFDLSGIQVASSEQVRDSIFFVSPVGDLLAVTEPQQFGFWQFLLPGKYNVEVNGTINQIELNPKEGRRIEPAFIKVSTPEILDAQIAVQVNGNPIYIELNQRHWLNLNELYPVLPGEMTLKVSDSLKSLNLSLVEGEYKNIEAKSIKVNYDCAPWEWLCLGSRAVYLFDKENAAPIAIGSTDVPIFYLEDQVWVSIEGSRDIKMQVPNQRKAEFGVGKLRIIPKHVHRAGQITDLVRVESGQSNIIGHTIDLELDQSYEMPLIAGTYNFSQYISSTLLDGDRKNVKRLFTLHPNENIEFNFQVFVSEKKWSSLKADGDSEVTAGEKRKKISLFKAIMPLRLQ